MAKHSSKVNSLSIILLVFLLLGLAVASYLLSTGQLALYRSGASSMFLATPKPTVKPTPKPTVKPTPKPTVKPTPTQKPKPSCHGTGAGGSYIEWKTYKGDPLYSGRCTEQCTTNSSTQSTGVAVDNRGTDAKGSFCQSHLYICNVACNAR